MREPKHRSTELFQLIRRTDKQLANLALFVHGFRGNYLTTWGGLGEQLQWEADNKPMFEDWDYAFVGYNTKGISTYLDIAHLVWTEWKKASNGEPPYGRKYTSLALFGHSLGTLGLRQALCASAKQPPSMLAALRSVTFFGSPINGSPLASFASLAYKIGDALAPGNPQLRMLKAWTESAHRLHKWPEVRLVLGLDDQVVGYENGELIGWAGDEAVPSITNFDHSGLVKPNGWNTAIIDYIQVGLS